MKKALVIYHGADLDGKGSGWFAYKYYREKGYRVKLKPMDYGKLLSADCVDYDVVVITDFSFDKEGFEFLINNNDKLIFIDHHKLDKKLIKYLNSNPNITVSWDTNYSALMLSYKLFNKNVKRYGIPTYVKLLDKFDKWDNSNKILWQGSVVPFQLACRSHNTDITTQQGRDFWKYIGNRQKSLLRQGKHIYRYYKQLCKEIVDQYAFYSKLDEFTCIVCNSSLYGSMLFDSIKDKDRFDIMVVYHYEPELKMWTYHLYRDDNRKDIDVSEIAKRYGGGGHPGASGFKIKELLFN